MKKLFTNALMFLACLISLPAFAQQETQFSQYMFNTLFYNPAYAGIRGQGNFALLHRTQWLGYNGTFDQGGAPNSQVLSFDAPFMQTSGIGIHITNDQIATVRNTELQVSYAYHIPLGNGKLSIGARAGAYNQVNRFNILRARESDDPLVNAAIASSGNMQIKPDVSAGLYYQTPDFYVGVSGTRLLQAEFDYGIAGLKNALSRNVYLTAGYNIPVNDQLVVTPSFLVKSDLNTYSFDVSAIATYDDRFWGGLSYRQGDAGIVMLGMNIKKNEAGYTELRAGYSFDYTLQGRLAKSATSHEFMVAYTIAPPAPIKKPAQRTPRYNH